MTLRADVVANKFGRRQHANTTFGNDSLAFEHRTRAPSDRFQIERHALEFHERNRVRL